MIIEKEVLKSSGKNPGPLGIVHCRLDDGLLSEVRIVNRFGKET